MQSWWPQQQSWCVDMWVAWVLSGGNFWHDGLTSQTKLSNIKNPHAQNWSNPCDQIGRNKLRPEAWAELNWIYYMRRNEWHVHISGCRNWSHRFDPCCTRTGHPVCGTLCLLLKYSPPDIHLMHLLRTLLAQSARAILLKHWQYKKVLIQIRFESWAVKVDPFRPTASIMYIFVMYIFAATKRWQWSLSALTSWKNHQSAHPIKNTINSCLALEVNERFEGHWTAWANLRQRIISFSERTAGIVPIATSSSFFVGISKHGTSVHGVATRTTVDRCCEDVWVCEDAVRTRGEVVPLFSPGSSIQHCPDSEFLRSPTKIECMPLNSHPAGAVETW